MIKAKIKERDYRPIILLGDISSGKTRLCEQVIREGIKRKRLYECSWLLRIGEYDQTLDDVADQLMDDICFSAYEHRITVYSMRCKKAAQEVSKRFCLHLVTVDDFAEVREWDNG
jgi:hypothetical protein